CGDPSGWHVDDDVGDSGWIRRDTPGVDGPHTQRDGAVSTRGGEAVLVPEQDSEVGTGIVGRGDEPAIHIRMPAGFEAQELAQLVHVGVVDGENPALCN